MLKYTRNIELSDHDFVGIPYVRNRHVILVICSKMSPREMIISSTFFMIKYDIISAFSVLLCHKLIRTEQSGVSATERHSSTDTVICCTKLDTNCNCPTFFNKDKGFIFLLRWGESCLTRVNRITTCQAIHD